LKKIIFNFDKPLKLVSGQELPSFELAYETYGQLNEDKSNAILVLHALSGSSHAGGKDGWWEGMIGPGCPLDTNKYFIICSNIIGSCYGSTGPSSINPKTGKPYGLDFPIITVKDMVNAQKLLIDHLGIKKLYSVIGGSLGGMQALEWAITYPNEIKSSIVIAATSRMSTQNIAFNETGRFAIILDPNFHNGDYYSYNTKPTTGLSLARMIAHITYLSEKIMDQKFGRELKSGKYLFDLHSIEFEVQSYLRYQGEKFVERFDANSYLYITKAMDYFDVTKELPNLKSKIKFLIIAFTSDWLFPVEQSMEIVKLLKENNNNVSFSLIDSDKGHDSFLIDIEEQGKIVSSFLEGLKNEI